MAQISSEIIFKQKPDLVWRTVEDGLVIVSPNNGEVKALNDLGGKIWLMLDGEHTMGQIYQSAAQSYADVPPDKLIEDIELFINSLLERNLLIPLNR
ncbi:MAG: PqqD family protein [Chloroflexota bacterium]